MRRKDWFQRTMTIVSTRARARKPGIRVRGYRIAVHFAGEIRPAQLTGTIWSADIPDLWNEVQQNEQVASATLFRTGRKFRTYQRTEVQA